jgi:hypothetical protein
MLKLAMILKIRLILFFVYVNTTPFQVYKLHNIKRWDLLIMNWKVCGSDRGLS